MEKITCLKYREIKAQESLQIQGQLLSWYNSYTSIQINRLTPICPGKSATFKRFCKPNQPPDSVGQRTYVSIKYRKVSFTM